MLISQCVGKLGYTVESSRLVLVLFDLCNVFSIEKSISVCLDALRVDLDASPGNLLFELFSNEFVYRGFVFSLSIIVDEKIVEQVFRLAVIRVDFLQCFEVRLYFRRVDIPVLAEIEVKDCSREHSPVAFGFVANVRTH